MTGILNVLVGFLSGVGEAVDEYFQYVTLLLHGDGTNGAQNNTFIDSSTNNFTITRNGNTTQGTFTPFSKPDGRWGISLDGSNDYLSVNVSGIAAGTSTFTLGFWVYLRAYPGTDAPFVDTRSSNGATTTAFQFGVYSTGALKFFDGTETNLGGTVPLNTWTHIQLVRDSGNTVTPYINGTATGTTVQCTRNLSDNFFWIGCVPGPASPYLNAYISNLFWLVGSATAPASGGPTSPQSTSTTNQKLLVAYGNRFVDANTATTAKTVTVSGATVTPFSPFPITTAYDTAVNGGAGYFDGSGDYLGLTGGSNLAFGTGDFTVEFWVNITGNGVFYDSRPASTDGVYVTVAASDFPSASGDSVSLVVSGSRRITGTANIKNGAWHHVAVCRSGSTTKLFVDGVQTGSDYTDTNNYLNGASRPFIGSQGFTAGSAIPTGYISDLRAVKGTALYTTTFTPPTAPLTAVSGTELLTNFTNAGIFDNTGFNALETVGNAQIDTTTKKYGTGSMEFDGSGDRLFGASRPDLDLSAGNWTIECWIYLNALNAYQMVCNLHASSGSASGLVFGVSNGNKIYIGNGVVLGTAGNTSLTTSTWYHIAAVKSGANVTFYLNGTADVTPFSFTPNAGGFITIGANQAGSDQLNGYIDDLRITKGIARYTSNFTPPTAAFPNIGS
jgi:hypothetical protein